VTRAPSIVRPLALAAALSACTTTVARESTPMEQKNRNIAEDKYEANNANDNPLIEHDLAKQRLTLRGYKKQ